MARIERRTPATILEQAGHALARASRCREAFDLEEAAKAYADAEELIREYDALDRLDQEDTRRHRLQIEAERQLVGPILNAHLRTYKENIVAFGVALSTALLVSPIHVARVRCCLGCVLIFENNPKDAIVQLRLAEKTFQEEAFLAGTALSQTRYHLARALLANKERDEAIKLLKGIFAALQHPETPHTPTHYELAAVMLLASQYQRLRRFKEARRTIRYANWISHNSGLQTTREGRRLRYLARWWGLWAIVHWFQRPGVPEI